MNVGQSKISRGWKYSRISGFVVVLAGLLSPHLQCLGQQSSGMFDPLKINWVSGPQQASLGDLVINIPKGYRLTDAHGARVILEGMNQPVPDDLWGALASGSGQWQAILEYSRQGWVKDTDIAKVNPAKLLKKIQRQLAQGTSAAASVKWLSPPVYDAQKHSLSWSYQVQTSSGKSLNETVILLGRQGILRITRVQAGASAEGPSLEQLAGNIAFKDGERYADYQNRDKIAKVGLAGLIAGGKDAEIFSGGFGSATAWAYCGLAGCAILGSVIVLRKRGRRRQPQPQRQAQTRAPVPAVAAATVPTVAATGAANGNGVGNGAPANGTPAVKNGGLNGRATAKVVPARQFQRNRRKRMFDYPKFYTNVMTELSRSYTAPTANGKSGANGYANGYDNGHTNGQGNGADAVKAEIVELIATQKNLIQEQKCLLEQQTRLIEEKRWLIEEQTAFLKAQTHGDDLQYPLKFE